MKTFWLHRDDIYSQGLSIGFKVFSPGHLIWLAVIALFCYLTGRYYRKLDSRGRDTMRKLCGLGIVLLEYAKIIVMGLNQVKILEFVPLHLCSAAGVGVLIYALWPKIKGLGQIFAYAFVPAAILAVVFPSTTMYPFLNFYSLHTFIFHGLIVAFFTWLFMSGEVVPSYKGVWTGYLFLALFALPIYFVDGVFRVNYMFLGLRSDVGILASIWDSVVPAYGRPGFLLVMAPIMAVVCHVFYLIYFLMGKLPRKRKEDKLLAAEESETDEAGDVVDTPDPAED